MLTTKYNVRGDKADDPESEVTIFPLLGIFLSILSVALEQQHPSQSLSKKSVPDRKRAGKTQ